MTARTETLKAALEKRILVLDGAMGTMIQAHDLGEDDFRGDRFAKHTQPLQGNNDVLSLTRPDIITEIHAAYLDVGSDIVETNTFSSTSIAQADYGLSDCAYDLNLAGAQLARAACDAAEARDPARPRFVAGALGPTNRTASIAPDVEDPAARNITYDDLKTAYTDAARGLVEGGADIILIETIFDTLNAKAAIHAVLDIFDALAAPLPIIISGTITDLSGRTLSGQTAEAFWHAVRHARPLAVGFNCALGAAELDPYAAEIARLADAYTCVYPNAGLPDAFGEYTQTPDDMGAVIGDWAKRGLVNIVGGCCGTTPAHITALAEAVRDAPPRQPPQIAPRLRLSGLEPFTLTDDIPFVNIGERTNITGSARFRDLILDGDYDAALEVARLQVENGAQLIDINMDEAMLDGEAAMTRFLHLVAGEPDIARVPFVIDSSKWSVIEAGLKCVQGKAVVNSISLKEGEAAFLEQARRIRRYGAAVVVMAFDTEGQAEDAARKFEICKRSYDLLTQEADFPPEDIIFDPNIFAVATGIEAHARYGVEFLDAAARIRAELPNAHVSGGVSNFSFSFRGNDLVREAMHAVFLRHAVEHGMNLGIVNAGRMPVYEEIAPALAEAIEDVLFARRPDAADRLLDLADSHKGKGSAARAADLSWRAAPVAERLTHALINGIDGFIDEDTEEARQAAARPLDVIEGARRLGGLPPCPRL